MCVELYVYVCCARLHAGERHQRQAFIYVHNNKEQNKPPKRNLLRAFILKIWNIISLYILMQPLFIPYKLLTKWVDLWFFESIRIIYINAFIIRSGYEKTITKYPRSLSKYIIVWSILIICNITEKRMENYQHFLSRYYTDNVVQRHVRGMHLVRARKNIHENITKESHYPKKILQN